MQSLTHRGDACAATRGALEGSSDGFLQDELAEGEVGDRPTQAGALAPEVPQALRLADLEATTLLTPAVVGDLMDAECLDNLWDLPTLTEQHLGLTQLGDDLLGAVGLAWHRSFLSGRS
jgi:hypothetical protein